MLSNCGTGKDSWESLEQQGGQTSQSLRKSTLNIHWKDWCWRQSCNTWAIWCEGLTHWKRSWAGKYWGQEKKGATEDEMVGSPHQLNGYGFEQTLGDSEGQGGLPGMLQSMALQRVGHNLLTEKQQPSKWSNSHICIWPLEKLWLGLHGPWLEKWCLCFLVCCLGLP